MTYHRTNSGHIELMAEWGHGKVRPDLPSKGVIIVDDNDGHYAAWKYEGDAREAALKIAGFLDQMRMRDETWLLTFDGELIEWVHRDYWADGVETVEVDEDGEPSRYYYHPEVHPNGLCVV